MPPSNLHTCFMLVAPEDQAALRAQADEHGAVNDFLLMGEHEGKALVHAILDVDHYAIARQHSAYLCDKYGELPPGILVRLNDPESGLVPRDWAGWPGWANR